MTGRVSSESPSERLAPSAIHEVLSVRIAKRWHLDIAAEHVTPANPAATADVDPGSDPGSEPGVWPMRVPLGSPTSRALEADWHRLQPAILELRRWATAHGLTVRDDIRRVFGASQAIPVGVDVPDLPTAARIVGNDFPELLATANERAPQLLMRLSAHTATGSPELASELRGLLAGLLRKTTSWPELDFAILLKVSDWFAEDPGRARGLTPRQVPIPGVHAKWLNSRGDQVRKLAGVADLGLADTHPARIHFTYLDPAYRADSTNRAHDSASVGDAVTLPYRPRIVIISENKDTAVNFPHLDRAVSVEGVGKGGGTAAAFDWIRNAETLIYWGDIDADGLEILDGFRAAGLPARSILMDGPTWGRYAHLGTDTHPDGRRIAARKPASVPHLTEAERELYLALCSPERSGFRRLEQERIPLTVALEAVLAVAVRDGARSKCD